MIEAPPVLTIRRNFERPDPDLLAALENVPTGFAVDALGGRGALDYRIKPIIHEDSPSPVFFGTALTCDCGSADVLAILAAVPTAQPGDVIIAAAEDCTATAVVGDQVLGMARNAGVRAFVTDGLVRDVDGIVATGVPTFSRGVSPNSPSANGPGSVGLPVTLGGVSVSSGDIIVGDRDGIVVIPRERLASVVAGLPAIATAEAGLEAKVAGGLKQYDLIDKLFSEGKIREID